MLPTLRLPTGIAVVFCSSHWAATHEPVEISHYVLRDSYISGGIMNQKRAWGFSGFHTTSAGVVCTLLLLSFASASFSAPQQPAAQLVVTVQNSMTLSDRFFSQMPIAMKANGDVFVGYGGVVVLQWEAATGTKTRLLQVNGLMPGYAGSVIKSVAPCCSTLPGTQP
jgi:hypothetical protein